MLPFVVNSKILKGLVAFSNPEFSGYLMAKGDFSHASWANSHHSNCIKQEIWNSQGQPLHFYHEFPPGVIPVRNYLNQTALKKMWDAKTPRSWEDS